MNGSISASVVAPPRPGSSPTQNPKPMPSSMKASAFHCSTSTRPSKRASIIARLFAELDVLRELLHHVFRLVEHFLHHLDRLLAVDKLELALRFLGLGHQLGALDRLGEGVLHGFHQLVGSLRRHDV